MEDYFDIERNNVFYSKNFIYRNKETTQEENYMIKEEKIMNDFKTAIIILNYKSWKDTLKEIEDCVKLLEFDYRDIIVIDNDSPNDSLDKLKNASKTKNFTFIAADKNLGYAAGNNIGMRFAKKNGYKYGWILNNDIIINDSEILNKMITVMKRDSSIAVVNPDIYAPNGYMFNRDAIRPSFWDMTLGIIHYKKKGRVIQNQGGYGYIYRPQGCCMLVDLDKLDEVDYMDENTFLYCEEPILAERLLKKHYHCACCCNTRVIHNHSTTVKTVFRKNKIAELNNISFKYYLKEYRAYSNVQISICLMFNLLKFLILK